MTSHALLSASSASRWIACPPSVRLTEGLEDQISSFAQEGTDAHELCAYLVDEILGRKARDPTAELTYYSEEMQECAEDYRNFVMEQVEKAKTYSRDPTVLIEQRLDFSKWVPEGFGTGDCVIVADGLLQVIDYKHGLGVLVSADHNAQMMCYSLGALDMFEELYEIETVTMTIFQPRRGNISTFEMTKDELLVWAEKELAPKAQLAYKGQGEMQSGKHCQFCKLKAVCRKRAEDNLALAKMEFADPSTLDAQDIAEILPKIDQLTSWANDVKAYAFEEATSGRTIPGYKLVEGRSTRKFTDESKVAQAVLDIGLDPYEKKLLTITAMTKLLGKKQFNDLLGGLIFKPSGKPQLVPIDDSRQEMNLATNDFKED
ncbi:DUF2800 domain-containing protein [Streptococcus cristatus]|uniref:DUF2800 domain-containing protein n=1 Tax=Streptococcus cristatus TaxID=45634 RepID=UPI001EF2EDEB|nr:DUF2800 domain-containing protein [Streptococcus cristatus]MCG7329931.1 DUF2800 domain-containing protein [Streptococcus cristatus]